MQGYEARESIEDYEFPVPDDVVCRMVEAYKTPILAWWHFKTGTKLGEHVPEVQMPKTPWEAGFIASMALDEVKSAMEIIKDVFVDGDVDESKYNELMMFRHLASHAVYKLLSARVYVDTIFAQKGVGVNDT